MSKPTKKTSKRSRMQEEDPFAAALNAVDKIKTVKPAKRQRDLNFFAEVERSLANSVRSASVNSNKASSSSSSMTNVTATDNDVGIVKAKTMSHKVYAGRRKVLPTGGAVPKLFDICIRFCINNIDAIEETGDIPFHVLRPILEKCTHSQLAKLESKNRYLEEDTDYLWEKHCHDVFPTEDQEDETWKHCFFRLTYERDERLKRLSAKISANSREIAQPQRKAMLADPIAPRDARRRQIKNGTMVHSSAVPSAVDLSRSRRQIFETGSVDALKKVHPAMRNATKNNGSGSGSASRPSTSSAPSEVASSSGSSGGGKSSSMNAIFAVRKTTPKKGALMVKTLKMMKARRN